MKKVIFGLLVATAFMFGSEEFKMPKGCMETPLDKLTSLFTCQIGNYLIERNGNGWVQKVTFTNEQGVSSVLKESK